MIRQVGDADARLGAIVSGAMKIYTRTGDGGETSLFSGGRVTKDDVRIEAYGTVDELNALLGVVRSEKLERDVDGELGTVQETLFAIGAALADPEGRLSPQASVGAIRVEPVERWIDGMEEELETLRSFILPGGCRTAALIHQARTVCRRAERRVQAIRRQHGEVSEGVVPYLNRLSDALFVLARLLNARLGIAEEPWPRSTSSP